MEDIKTYRLKLGLSQVQFSEYLGIHRTQLVRAENGETFLNNAALKKLKVVGKCLDNHVDVEATIKLKNGTDECANYCKTEESKVVLQLTKCIRNLERITRNYNELNEQNMLLCVEGMAYPAELVDKITYQKLIVQHRLKYCNEAVQEILKLKISMLSAQLTAIRKFRKKKIKSKP